MRDTASVILDHRETNHGHCHQRCFLLEGFFLDAADFGGALLLMRDKSVARSRESVDPGDRLNLNSREVFSFHTSVFLEDQRRSVRRFESC